MAENEEEPGGDRGPSSQLTTWVVIGVAIVLIAGLFGVRFEHQPETTRDYPGRPQIPDAEAMLLEAPEIDDEYLPCDDCHDNEEINRAARVLEDEHDETELVHGDLWCLHCHDAEDHESLHLADGALVALEDSWKLCTQCHAKKLPDWRAGVHGKRTGHWRGEKQYRTCVTCHEPHAPAFQPMAPKPPPKRPEEITLRSDAEVPAGESSDEES